MHSQQIGIRRHDFDSFEYTVEAGLHDDLGSKQPDSPEAAPADFSLDNVQTTKNSVHLP